MNAIIYFKNSTRTFIENVTSISHLFVQQKIIIFHMIDGYNYSKRLEYDTKNIANIINSFESED